MRHDPSIRHHMPALRHRKIGSHADRCMPVLLYLHRLWRDAAAQVRRLLRVLLVRLRAVPAGPGRALGAGWRTALRRRIAAMAGDTSRDWLRNPHTSALAWWAPQSAMVVGLFLPVPLRTIVWIVALIWMGTACVLNAKRCGRTHCRY